MSRRRVASVSTTIIFAAARLVVTSSALYGMHFYSLFVNDGPYPQWAVAASLQMHRYKEFR